MIDRKLLQWGNSASDLTNFICSRCSIGRLEPKEELKGYQPPYSTSTRAADTSWEDIELSLTATLRCSNDTCGQEAILRGIGGVEPDYDVGPYGPLEEYFFVKCISPSPYIINLPESLPQAVKAELTNSFEVFWFNKELAANAIRNSLEALLTHFGVPDEVDGKWVSFGNRLRLYAEKSSTHTEFFSLLRPIINSGSHGDKVETETVLDIYEALEIFLEDVFNDRSRRFVELTDRLRRHRTDDTMD